MHSVFTWEFGGEVFFGRLVKRGPTDEEESLSAKHPRPGMRDVLIKRTSLRKTSGTHHCRLRSS